jgi:hypothetical protein
MADTTRRCECGDVTCRVQIVVSIAEQDAVDHDPRNLWIVAPEHDLRGARTATTIHEGPRYKVIEVEEFSPEDGYAAHCTSFGCETNDTEH